MKSEGLLASQVDQKIHLGKLRVQPKPGARAGYWQYFNLILDEQNHEVPFIRCRKCLKLMKRAKNAGSTSFEKHAEICSKEGGPQQSRLEKFTVLKVHYTRNVFAV